MCVFNWPFDNTGCFLCTVGAERWALISDGGLRAEAPPVSISQDMWTETGWQLNPSLYVLRHTTTKRRSRRGGGPADEWLFGAQLLSGCHFYSRMEKDGRKSKTFVSTFRLNLKPRAKPLCVERQREDGLDPTNRTLMGNKKLGVSSTTGKDLTSTGNSWCVHLV